eukprot:scaffold21370_cov67-Phaeocystis_antarctica.AAC.14
MLGVLGTSREYGDFGGDCLQTLGVPNHPAPLGAPEDAQGPRPGTASGGHFEHAAAQAATQATPGAACGRACASRRCSRTCARTRGTDTRTCGCRTRRSPPAAVLAAAPAAALAATTAAPAAAPAAAAPAAAPAAAKLGGPDQASPMLPLMLPLLANGPRFYPCQVYTSPGAGAARHAQRIEGRSSCRQPLDH